MSALGKSPSLKRVGIIAGAFAVLASAVTPACAAAPVAKERVVKKRPHVPPPPPAPRREHSGGGAGGSGGPMSLDWSISSALRP